MATLGCSEDMKIRKYKVAKSDSNRTSITSTSVAQSEKTEQSILGVIVPREDRVWFFKLMGELKKVDESKNDFRKIVDTIRFAETGDPTWALPEGWKNEGPQGMLHAKLLQPQQGIAATVMHLPLPRENPTVEDWHDYVELNVNRWRKQLSLEEQDWASMEPGLEVLQELDFGPTKAYFVSITGQASAGGSSMSPPMVPPGTKPPFVDQGSAPQTPSIRPAAPSSAPTYTAPKKWIDVGASGMRLASFQIEQDGLKGEVSVIPAGGDQESNVARWQRQLTPDATNEQIRSVLDSGEEVDVNGVRSKIYFILGKEGEDQPAFIAAIIDWQPAQSLFVKFSGPAKLAESQRAVFTEFVKSIKW